MSETPNTDTDLEWKRIIGSMRALSPDQEREFQDAVAKHFRAPPSPGDVTGPLTDDDRQRLASIRRGIPHMNDAGGIWPRDVEFLLGLVDRAFAVQNVSRGDVTGTPAPTEPEKLTSEPTVSALHDAAMQAADLMLEARERHDELTRHFHARQAFDWELLALQRAADRGVSEVTRTILFRSMVALGREAFSVSRPDLTGETPPVAEQGQ